MKYTAKEWAEWKSASNVLDILLSWEQAGAADIDEDMSPSSDTSNALFQDAVDSSLWRNAMAEDWKMTKEWCDVRAIVPMAIGLVNRTDSPERMFHWGVRQYLQFALLCNDSARKNTTWKGSRPWCGKGSKSKWARRCSSSKQFMTMVIFIDQHSER